MKVLPTSKTFDSAETSCKAQRTRYPTRQASAIQPVTKVEGRTVQKKAKAGVR